jgi:hypothetical protein
MRSPRCLCVSPITFEYNVTCRLKAGIVEPEEPAVDRQRLGKNIPAPTNRNAVIKELLDAVFSIRSVSYQRKVGEYFFSEFFVIYG